MCFLFLLFTQKKIGLLPKSAGKWRTKINFANNDEFFGHAVGNLKESIQNEIENVTILCIQWTEKI